MVQKNDRKKITKIFTRKNDRNLYKKIAEKFTKTYIKKDGRKPRKKKIVENLYKK